MKLAQVTIAPTKLSSLQLRIPLAGKDVFTYLRARKDEPASGKENIARRRDADIAQDVQRRLQ